MRSTWDNTILSDFKKCMRFGYYRHVRGWVPEDTSPALVFGQAWHAAMDVVWKGLCHPNYAVPDDDVAESAMKAFMTVWYENGCVWPLPLAAMRYWAPRTPDTARLMIEAYIAKRGKLLGTFELLHTEEKFSVPLAQYMEGDVEVTLSSYVGRRDKLIRTNGGDVMIIEHKTTAWGSDKGFRDVWAQSWTPKSQLDGYLYSAREVHENVKGIWVDGALVHGTHRFFDFIPVRRHQAHIDSWLAQTKWWVAQISEMWNNVADVTETHMASFPLNTEACVQYNRLCPYIDVCRAHPNPEKLRAAPRGFVEKFWEPHE